MLDGCEPLAFLATTDVDVARDFYGGLLGLPIDEETPFALVVRAGPIALRIVPMESVTPQPFTVFGWWVPDVYVVVDHLVEHGVPTIRYDGMEQDERGVWVAPGGARIAWFHDPDGNTLSVTQP